MTGRSLFTAAAAAEAKAGRAEQFGDAIRALDLTGCHLHEIVLPLLEEFEGDGITHWRDSWPHAVNARIDRELDAFRAAHADAAVLCGSTAIGQYRGRKCCILVLHYRKPTV